MKFGIQGERGCHSHVALLGLKQKAVDYKCYADFKSLFQGLMDGHVEQVIVPLENSISGTFFQILDSIMQLKLFIVDEYQTRDEHCLAAVAGSDAIVEVQSHPYVFDQCSSFLSTIGSAKVIQTLDTASAARTISRQNQPNIAAIVSPMCAKLYNLEIIKNVADDSDSITRYVFVSKKQGDNPERHENPRTSLCVVLKNQTGSLERAIACFSHRDLNLSKLESRPSSRAIKVRIRDTLTLNDQVLVDWSEYSRNQRINFMSFDQFLYWRVSPAALQDDEPVKDNETMESQNSSKDNRDLLPDHYNQFQFWKRPELDLFQDISNEPHQSPEPAQDISNQHLSPAQDISNQHLSPAQDISKLNETQQSPEPAQDIPKTNDIQQFNPNVFWKLPTPHGLYSLEL